MKMVNVCREFECNLFIICDRMESSIVHRIVELWNSMNALVYSEDVYCSKSKFGPDSVEMLYNFSLRVDCPVVLF